MAIICWRTAMVVALEIIAPPYPAARDATLRELARKRREYLNTIFTADPVEPFTKEMAPGH
jgi:hypothetical protein